MSRFFMVLVLLVFDEFHLGDLRPAPLLGADRSRGKGWRRRLRNGRQHGLRGVSAALGWWLLQCLTAELPHGRVADFNAVPLAQNGDDGVIRGMITPQFADEFGVGAELDERPGALRAVLGDEFRRARVLIWKVHWKLFSKRFLEVVSETALRRARSKASHLHFGLFVALCRDYFAHAHAQDLGWRDVAFHHADDESAVQFGERGEVF